MIPVNNQDLFDVSLQQLAHYKKSVGRSFKGRFIQLFLGLKFYQNQIPSVRSGAFISSQDLQTLLDDLYTKSSDQVLMIFEGKYLARTGVTKAGNQGPQNTWRNHLNIQKGIGCYAPAATLATQAFLNQPRSQCQYLVTQHQNTFSGSHCNLCALASYRNEQHRKWLQIDVNHKGYAAIDSSDIKNFKPYVAAQLRIPVLPLIVALYYNASKGTILSQRNSVDIQDFESDFNLSYAEFSAYFDDSPLNQYNTAIIAAGGNFSYTQAIRSPGNLPSNTQVPSQNSPPADGQLPSPVLSGTPVQPPKHNTGWEAQQYVFDALVNDGWTVNDVSNQQLGYDLWARKGRRTIFVEVKSSLAICVPTLTSREWQRARAHKSDYVLAIVENFASTKTNTVYWIPISTVLSATKPVKTVNYSVPRSAWTTAISPLSQI